MDSGLRGRAARAPGARGSTSAIAAPIAKRSIGGLFICVNPLGKRLTTSIVLRKRRAPRHKTAKVPRTMRRKVFGASRAIVAVREHRTPCSGKVGHDSIHFSPE